MDTIRDNVGAEGLKRIHLVDKKELLNISNAYGLQSIQRHINDQQSVLSWLKEWETIEKFYKMQRQISTEHSCLTKDDFMIVIQTESQKQL